MRRFEAGNLNLCWVRVPTMGPTLDWGWANSNILVKLKEGDVIYYWIRVYGETILNTKLNAVHVVKDFFNRNGTRIKQKNLIEYPDTDYDNKFCPDPDCGASDSQVQGRSTPCAGDIMFREEFNEPIKRGGVRKWTPEVAFVDGPDFPFNFYSTEGTVDVDMRNGNLVIKPVLLDSVYGDGKVYGSLDLTRNCTGLLDSSECKREAFGADILPPVITGKLTTKNYFNFKYGKIEIRAKLPSGDWLIPEIILEPTDHVYGNGRYASGMLRIAFSPGNAESSRTLYGGPVLSSREPIRSQFLKEKIGTDDWNKEFHNYSVVWLPDSITMLVDGEEYGFIDKGIFFQSAEAREDKHTARWLAGSALAPMDEMFYISLGLRVGGSNDFQDVNGKPYKNGERKAILKFWEARDSWLPTWRDGSMLVDYVRVYAL
ncbi:beta-1,3-glucan-binding protein [Plutella xylostella]|uniref:beta-1,3-glucan-binding protein n=1 Tax=Plutella xylostella TaxID=51655 RepID=UPI002032832E|nr:beta-1,3-glucan-binding protein [Plutella xylostella]